MDPSPWRESVHVIAELLRDSVISRSKIVHLLGSSCEVSITFTF
jgi:hypothetical protein